MTDYSNLKKMAQRLKEKSQKPKSRLVSVLGNIASNATKSTKADSLGFELGKNPTNVSYSHGKFSHISQTPVYLPWAKKTAPVKKHKKRKHKKHVRHRQQPQVIYIYR